MKKLSILALTLFICSLFSTAAVAQAWRGMGRLQGVVTDEAGKPIAGAKVKLTLPKAGDTGPAPITTDARGKWAAMGLMGGVWNIDIEAEGYVPQQGSAPVSEAGQRTPPIKTAMRAMPKAEPEPEPAQNVASSVPPEAVAAVKAGEDFMAQGKFKEAVAEFEKAQALLPEHIQLKQALAQAYYKAGQPKQAVALLKQVHAAQPDNTGVILLLTNLLFETEQFDEGKALLEGLPAGTITDPNALVNFGILFLNKNRLADAYTYFDKAVTLDPNRGETYYYRGLALLQQQKMKEAKADLQKVTTLAPTSSEAEDAKALLAQMK